MQFLKWTMIGLGLVSSVSLYWVLNIDQNSYRNITFTLIEQQTTLGFPLWLLGGVMCVIGLLLPSSQRPSESAIVLNDGLDSVEPRRETEPSQGGGKMASGTLDESMFMADWKIAVQSEIKATVLPSGAQIVDQPFNNVQLGLTLKRTTPQNSRLAMVAFAQMLSKIPTPHRVRITLIDVMATGIPLKNIAQGAFTQYFGKIDFILTEQIDGLEVRFNKPDERWS